jgi:hypothetical protein
MVEAQIRLIDGRREATAFALLPLRLASCFSGSAR